MALASKFPLVFVVAFLGLFAILAAFLFVASRHDKDHHDPHH